MPQKSTAVYYGSVRKIGPIFIRAADACRLARIHWAVTEGRTWGEFASKVPLRVMHELLNDGERMSFHKFCEGWLYQSLGWPEEQAIEWFRDALRSYTVLSRDERWPLPEEACWVEDAMSDGDWPEWPSQTMLDWMPADVIQRFGHTDSSRLNGMFVQFKDGDMDEIVRRLTAANFNCRRNDMLVELASGNADPDISGTEMQRIIEDAERPLV